jgi:hypothetical protein
MAKKIRNYGVNDIGQWKFNDIGIPQEWYEHLGDISEGFRMIIQGNPGHGKTEYVMQLSKMLATHYGKVNLNNTEQGKSKTLKEAFIRNNMNEIPPGKWTLCDKSQNRFDAWFKRLSGRNTGRVIILDSRDYMDLTIDQFKQLHEKFKKKAIIIVCWDAPFSIHSKEIKYLCDIKVKVHNFRARIVSRFGGNKTWVIWDKPHNLFIDAKTKEVPMADDEEPVQAKRLINIFSGV